jgi:uncharacterized membrane protein YidH (DUF202 family)
MQQMVGRDRPPALAPVPGVQDHPRMDEEGQPPDPGQEPGPAQPLPQPPPQGLGQQPPPGLGAGPSARPSPHREANANAGWLVLTGGVLVIVGVFLPWITASGPNGTFSTSGKDANEWAFLILGGFATIRGFSMARPQTFRFQLGTPLIGGVILAILAALRWGDLQNALDVARVHPAYTASIGIGFWAVIGGTVLVLLGGVLAMQRRRM